MNLILYRNCFLVGLSAAAAIGPIFVLVFNRGALYGFRKGFVTAIGAAIGDGLLFCLSFIGLLSFLETSRKIVIAMDFVVSILLIFVGIKMLTRQQSYESNALECKEPTLVTITKSFVLTVINPLTIFFFMFISVKVIPENIVAVSRIDSLIASAMISLGSLTTFSTIALFARNLRRTIGQKQLHLATYATAIAFVVIGIYFSFDLVKQIAKYFGWL
jgi:threonine/homoserine/homoserine lactone efflux protein